MGFIPGVAIAVEAKAFIARITTTQMEQLFNIRLDLPSVKTPNAFIPSP